MGRESRDQPQALADIRRLIADIKAVRREAETLRVRCWQGEDRIAELEAALRAADAERRDALDDIGERERQIAVLRCFAGGPPMACGFRVGEGASAVAGGAVRRRKDAPSGTMIFGPYLRLPPGRYVSVAAARLYQPTTAYASFTMDAVCGGGQRVIAVRRFRTWPWLPARPCRLVFSIPEGFDCDDFEIRVWARAGTPLEISRIGLRRLAAAAALPAGGAHAVPARSPGRQPAGGR